MLKPKLNCAVRRWIASPLNYPQCNHLQDSLSCPEKGRVSRSFFKRFRANTRFQDFVSTVFHNFRGVFHISFHFSAKLHRFAVFGGCVFHSIMFPRIAGTGVIHCSAPLRNNVGQTTTAQTAQARFTCYSPQVSSHPAGTIRPGIARACRARRRARTKDVARIAWT